MNDNQKKQIPLRLSPKLYNAIAAWAEDDFRSVNGQIEYLLKFTDCVFGADPKNPIHGRNLWNCRINCRKVLCLTAGSSAKVREAKFSFRNF